MCRDLGGMSVVGLVVLEVQGNVRVQGDVGVQEYMGVLGDDGGLWGLWSLGVCNIGNLRAVQVLGL